MSKRVEVGDELLLTTYGQRRGGRRPVLVESVGRRYFTVTGHRGRFVIETLRQDTDSGCGDWLITPERAQWLDERSGLLDRYKAFDTELLTNDELRAVVEIVEAADRRRSA